MAPAQYSAALPLVSKLVDCADYSKTVAPFKYQLYNLPGLLLDAGLTDVYASTNPVISGLAFSLAIAPIFFIVSEANKNYSQVDRVWSILPTLYNAHFWFWARLNGESSLRLDAIFAISTIWSARLTFNYWRKGGYSVGSEDYRWNIIKKWVNNAPVWFVFNATFISTIQSVLLFLVTTPTYIILLANRFNGSDSLLSSDYFFIGLLLCLILTEFTADNQQWDYHAAKQTYGKTARVPKGWKQADLDRGFNTTGLWQYTRHPNFTAEQGVWIALYLWSCVEAEVRNLFSWTCVGVLAYMSVFQGSTWLTELISSGKYPEYKVYQDRVGRFLPRLVGQGWDEYVEQTIASVGKHARDESPKSKAS